MIWRLLRHHRHRDRVFRDPLNDLLQDDDFAQFERLIPAEAGGQGGLAEAADTSAAGVITLTRNST